MSIVGIDLGTTFSAIAAVNGDGKCDILPNREGERITPSVVLFDGGMPIVGSMAKRSAVSSPLNVVQFVKRQMGNPSWRFRAESGDVYTAEEISAIILRRLKEDAEVVLQETIREAVITVPAYFDDAQRKATHDAGRIAGLDVARIINEPTAAALSYGLQEFGTERTVLVYDLGGGTFDVTIMRVSKHGVEVLATGGDKNLGGFDWDNQLMVFLNEEFKNQGGPDLLSEPTFEQELRDKAELAKKVLSSRDATKVVLSADGVSRTIDVSLSQFNSITESLLKRTGSIMGFVLEDAGLGWDTIDKLLLVGGSTRMKAVPNLIEQLTGKKPSTEVHPDEVVAVGAAWAGFLHKTLVEAKAGKTVGNNKYALVAVRDINSHSLGVVALDGHNKEANSIVLKRGTRIPCKVSDTFGTVTDNQTELCIRVTEGEDHDLAYVKVVGESTMRIPPYPKGAPVDVFFEYDENGIIHVSVFDVIGNKMLGEFPIARVSNRTEDEVSAMQQKLRKVVVT